MSCQTPGVMTKLGCKKSLGHFCISISLTVGGYEFNRYSLSLIDGLQNVNSIVLIDYDRVLDHFIDSIPIRTAHHGEWRGTLVVLTELITTACVKLHLLKVIAH